MPTESLEQLTTSLKSAQSRAKSLSANFARLMHLVLDEEIEAVDRDIALVKAGKYEPLNAKDGEAEKERDVKKRIANARLVKAEHEIDIRFGAMVDAEWKKFTVYSVPPPFILLLSFISISFSLCVWADGG